LYSDFDEGCKSVGTGVIGDLEKKGVAVNQDGGEEVLDVEEPNLQAV